MREGGVTGASVGGTSQGSMDGCICSGVDRTTGWGVCRAVQRFEPEPESHLPTCPESEAGRVPASQGIESRPRITSLRQQYQRARRQPLGRGGGSGRPRYC